VDAAQHLGLMLRTLRLEAGMTQEDLARAAQLHPTEVSRLERAERDPRLSTLVRLAAALQVPLGELLDPAP
jgi:XRE family transcriptional regulator, fatty acid utilization regulator